MVFTRLLSLARRGSEIAMSTSAENMKMFDRWVVNERKVGILCVQKGKKVESKDASCGRSSTLSIERVVF